MKNIMKLLVLGWVGIELWGGRTIANKLLGSRQENNEMSLELSE